MLAAGEAWERNERGFVTMLVEPSTEGHKSLREVLRAIEQDEKDHMPLPNVAIPAGEDKRSIIPLAPPVVSRLGDVADADAPHDWDDIDAERVSPWWSNRIGFSAFAIAAVGASFMAPVAIMVLAGSIVITPLPSGDWAVASLDDVKFDSHSAGAVPAAEKTGEIRQAGFARIQGFAGLWHALTKDAPPPRLSTKLTIEAGPGETVALPIHIESSGPLPSNANLIVRGVPEFAALSSAEPQQDGTWRVAIPSAGDVKLTAYAHPVRDQELTFELQGSDGQVVTRASTLFKAGSEPPAAEVAAIEPALAVETAAAPTGATVLPETPARKPVLTSAEEEAEKAPVKAASERRSSKPRKTASAPMRAGLTGVEPQPRPSASAGPKTPRIVIVDGPLPAAASQPMASFSPAPSPAPAPVDSPSIHDTNNSWQEPWARNAFRTH